MPVCFIDGSCMEFRYSTHGSSWRGASLSVNLLNKDTNRYSQAMWQKTTSDQPHWQSARFSIPAQTFLFKTAKIVLIKSGGGSLSDLGFDDLHVVTGSCGVQTEDICPPEGRFLYSLSQYLYTLSHYLLLSQLTIERKSTTEYREDICDGIWRGNLRLFSMNIASKSMYFK